MMVITKGRANGRQADGNILNKLKRGKIFTPSGKRQHISTDNIKLKARLANENLSESHIFPWSGSFGGSNDIKD